MQKSKENRNKFAQLLDQYVGASGMRRDAITSAAHITYAYLRLLLLGERNPSESVVLSLSKALRLSDEQTGELLSSAGHAPSPLLLHSLTPEEQTSHLPVKQEKRTTRITHLWQRLEKEIPETLEEPFVEEMERLFDYARYKYLLCGGVSMGDLQISHQALTKSYVQAKKEAPSSLEFIATLVAELCGEQEIQEEPLGHNDPPHPPLVAEVLTNIDQMTGSILAGELPSLNYQSHLVEQIRDVLRQGVPWEIRRRITEALPGICRFDAPGAYQLLQHLRLDQDAKYGFDIRRRVIEALVSLFDADPSFFSQIVDLLHPQVNDDLYVALAAMESCCDIQLKLKHQKRNEEGSVENTSLSSLLNADQSAILKVQRLLLVERSGAELECLQYLLALYDLQCSPDAMLLSVQEGLQLNDKGVMQLVAARFLERMLPLRQIETLKVYKLVLDQVTSRNVRRTVARAMPSLIKCMQEASLPIRTMARTIIITLAQDSDIHIRRTVADYAIKIFQVDREFLLILLRHLHQDRDPAIRHRLQPIALRLAQVWLLWYAETAGLVYTTRRKTETPFGE